MDVRAFGWDRALVATLRHSSLPWEEALAVTPLAEVRELGARDRLSLLAQFAAHEAMLQFAGIADGEFDPAEWAAVQKRGSDVRLVRVAARACDPSLAPPVLTLAQQFAEQIGAELDMLRQSWARADAIYAEAFARVTRDAAADVRWMRRAACGAIAAPGAEGLRVLANDGGRFGYASDNDCVEAVQRFAEIDGSFQAIVLRGASPLERYSALGALVPGTLTDIRSASVPAVAEQILAATSRTRHVFIVVGERAFDEGSRQVVDLLSNAKHGTWLIPGDANALPDSRPFLIAPRLAARNALDLLPHEFVDSPAFAAYLAHGDVPARSATLPSLSEPARSYIGALALLGTVIPRSLAAAFLGDFLFSGGLEELVVEGVTSLDDASFVFASDAVRDEAALTIPVSSRPAICRVAASHADGVRAALLWLDAGDAESAAAVLDRTEWQNAEETVASLRRVPEPVLTPALARRYAHALIDCGRYRDARDLGTGDELILARVERRMGDYAIALSRLENGPATFESQLLRAELLRLTDREKEAARALDACQATTAEEQAALDYERALLDLAAKDDGTLPPDHYLAARLASYRAHERGDYDDAARSAHEAHRRARNTIERIDASLDRLFAVFSAGEWDLARAVAVEALQEVEETQGDRAAGGILFTLAYLAADAGQWVHASQRIARLRHYYTANSDSVRLGEVQLLGAHLDFSRGRFADARRAAQAVYDSRGIDQVREAAAVILDELERMEGRVPRFSTGRSGNAELKRRHERLHGDWQHAAGDSVPAKLIRFRVAIANGDAAAARAIATELDLAFDATPEPTEIELRILRAAATRDFPFAAHDFDMPWCFATRNRLGQWSAIGSHAATSFDHLDEAVDWTACSEREWLFVEGSSQWTIDGREAVAAIFRTRAENHRFRRVLEQEENSAPVRPASGGAIDGIVGQSPAIREIESLVARVARRDVAVCILGESGTGKELIARAMHRQSARRQKTFTPVNCAALPENLIESELFGHVRGAFTGADRDRAGLIETTDGGTLFLDEVGELPLPAQAKLLRFLQEGEFRRVGDTVNRSADVRIVSATNMRLDAAVEEGRFRDDLYYRIRGVEVLLPPLRERGADIALLATHFLAAERAKHRSGPALLSSDTEAIFAAYPWPGNVRELQNTIRAAHAMAGEAAREIEVEHLPERLRNVAPARNTVGSYQHAVTRFKRDLIERSLVESAGNQNKAAAALKMSRQALAYQIRELGILVRG
ncbi:MAG: sigma 54-interacting transcriptional regulator [Acidobacteriota bacterium]|nr:sigma 54-interacting transcriptional regulator [Acidobacteriota bacterium]